MFLFGRKSKTHLGLDIGTSAIKLVELGKEEGRYKLENYGIFPLRDYLKHLEKRTKVDSSKMLEKEIAEMIRQIIQETGIKSRKASLSIPVYSSFSTLIDLPPMPEKEIAAAVPFEAKKYVPVPISEVILDWSIIEKTRSQPSQNTASGPKPDNALGKKDIQEEKPKTLAEKAGSEGVQILLVAVPKEVATKYSRIVQLAGLELETLEAETFSLTRSLVGNDKSPIVIVDTGARSSNISIVDKGYIRITHNLEMGGAELTKTLSQKMNISFEKAEEIKKTGQDLLGDRQAGVGIKETASPVIDTIVSEVKRIIGHYQTRYNRQIEKCILAGGGLIITSLIDAFSTKLGLEVSLGNPFARIIYLPSLEPAIKELGPSLAVAVGLAMRE